MTDNELVLATRRGERDAFGRLVAKYQDVVWAVSYSSTRDRALGDDVTQDTFIAAWRQIDQLRDTTTVRAWLCGIARNLARRARRRGHREELVDTPDAAMEGTPFDHTAAAEAEAVVRDALARVPERYREVLVLYYREGYALRDVAEALGLSEANVLQRLARGRRYLADGVARLVERSLERARPRRDLVSGVLVTIASLAAASRVDATPTKGSTMLKLALVTSLLTAGGATAYVVHTRAVQPSTPTALTLPAAALATAPSSAQAAHAATAAPSLPLPAKHLALPIRAFAPGPDDARVVPAAELARLHLTSGPSRGDADAPVTIVVFQDNKCPYCEQALGTLDQLLDDYPHKLRIIVKQLVVHPTAELSAEACYAADAQGKFWEMHDLIFQHQDALSREALIDYAHEIGLDVVSFTRALDEHTYKKQVDADAAAAKDIDVNATPGFLINGRVIVGVQPVGVFRAAIDEALAHAS